MGHGLHIKKISFSLDTLLSVGLMMLLGVCAYYYILPSGRYTLAAMHICLIGIVSLILFIDNRLISHIVPLAICFVSLSLMFFFFTYPGSGEKALGIITQQFLFAFPVLIFYIMSRRKTGVVLPLILLLVFILFVAVKTWIELNDNPTLARLLASVDSDTEDLMAYRMDNLGGFGFSYGVMFVSIALGFSFNRIKVDVFTLVALIIVTAYIIKTQYLTAMLIVFITFIITMLHNKSTHNKRKDIVKAVQIVLLIAFAIALPPLLRYFATLFGESPDIANKLVQLADFLSGQADSNQQAGGLYGRFFVYQESYDLFLQSPLFGNDLRFTTDPGGHSTILDLAAKTGIIGVIIYGFIIRCVWRLMQEAFMNYGCEDKYATAYIMIPYLVLSLLNPTLNVFEISIFAFLFAPLLIVFNNNRKKRLNHYEH